jgi:hypothetical protein
MYFRAGFRSTVIVLVAGYDFSTMEIGPGRDGHPGRSCPENFCRRDEAALLFLGSKRLGRGLIWVGRKTDFSCKGQVLDQKWKKKATRKDRL